MLLNTLVEGTARVSLVSQSGASFCPWIHLCCFLATKLNLGHFFAQWIHLCNLICPQNWIHDTFWPPSTRLSINFARVLDVADQLVDFLDIWKRNVDKVGEKWNSPLSGSKYVWKYWEEKVTNKRHLWVVQDIFENIEKKRWQTKRHLWVVLCEDCHRPISSWTLEGCPVLHFVPGDGTPTFFKV